MHLHVIFTFYYCPSTQIDFFRTEIMSLSDSDTAFNGLEEVLTRITASDCEILMDWNFEQLRNLEKLQDIYFHSTTINSIDHTLPYLPKLSRLSFNGDGISDIIDDAFAKLPNLEVFNFGDNKITEMKRSMFSNPANSLNLIILW